MERSRETNIRGARQRDEGVGAVSAMRSGAFATGAAVLLSVIFWLIAGGIAYANDDPDSIVGMLGIAVVSVTAFVSGIIAVKINGGSGALVCGVTNGVLYMVLLFLLSLFFDESFSSGYPFMLSLVMRCAVVFISVLGAFAGAHRTPRKRKRRAR